MRASLLYKVWKCCLMGLLLGILGACCKHEDEPTPALHVYDKVHIIYMVAENSLSSFLEYDMKEINSALVKMPSESKVVVYVDDTNSSRIYAGVGGSMLQQTEQYKENICSTDSAQMRKVLQDIFNEHRANYYTLTLWSHGSGWIVYHNTTKSVPRTSFGIDNGQRSYIDTGVQMNITTLSRVLSQFPHFGIILADACYMQCVEVAYELRKLTDYYIASAAEIPAEGAPYDKVLLMMDKGLAIEAAKEYVNYYTKESEPDGVILSVVNTTLMDSFAEATSKLCSKIFQDKKTADVTNVLAYNTNVPSYYTEYYDMSSLLHRQIDKTITEAEYQTWKAVALQTIPYYYIADRWFSSVGGWHYIDVKDKENSLGISVFAPSVRYETNGMVSDYHQFQWYSASGMDKTGW